jgi:hypothetical protein
MDPITAAIVAALPALAADLVKSSVKDAYTGLKEIIRRKWGSESQVAKSVDALEANPKSGGQAVILSEQIAAVNATADAEVMVAVATLLDELRNEGIGGAQVAQIAIKISGSSSVQGVVGAKNISIGSLNFESPPVSKKRP